MTDATPTAAHAEPKGHLDQLLSTLLYEGYALYPYTPGATKNATPTPFGIVYPPLYAQQSPSTFDHLRLQVIVQAVEAPALAVTALFLEPAGERHEGVERRVELPATSLAALETEPVSVPFAFDAVQGHVRMAAQAFHDGLVRVTASVHNSTEVPQGLDRPGALRASLLSTHVVATVTGGTFVSPIAPPEHAATANMACANVNTFPVLATPEDDVILGAAIVLPDHPQIAPESMGSLFDSTEIEEALLLHLLALSDAEVESIAQQDPAVREMLRRAIQTTPEEFAKLRGRVTMADAVVPLPGGSGTIASSSPRGSEHRAPGDSGPPPARVRFIDAAGNEVPLAVPTIGDELRGERELVVDGVMYRLGDQVRLRPQAGRNAQDHLLVGRTATIERIYVDYADAVHLCVTIDDDPGQELMRDIGRYLYFKPLEVEVIP
ncbi:MAG: hypothetical protein JWN65_772 [Solirubrobacterales bacterium]|nr:hypothetical protein [Solirubrobacterales bacterium]